VRRGAIDTAALVRSKKLSAVDAVRESLAAIDRGNGAINAVVETLAEPALARAKEIDARVARGDVESLPLAGVPVVLKDNICLDRGHTTCASEMLRNFQSPYTATAAARLEAAGAIVVGKANLDEFAMGGSTEHSCFGPTRNPWDVSRVPGGSSGGSAAAVAAGFVPLALGSDTGGSIRQPASHCGVVGVKPTYGRVSRYGLVAYASSLDQIGPMSTSVADAALALQVIAGNDEHDMTSSSHAVPPFIVDLERPVGGNDGGLVIGVPKQARGDGSRGGVRGGIHGAVGDALEHAIRVYQKLGAEIVEIDLPMTDAGIAAYYIIATAEASSNLARFDGVRYGRRATLAQGEGLFELYAKSRGEGFGAEVKRRIMLGTHVLSSGYYDAYYATALKARRRIFEDFQKAFAKGCRAILMPNSPSPAFKIGAKTNDPLALYLEDVFTVGVNLAGLPAISVPTSFATDEGRTLPIGMQLVGASFDEGVLLRVARMLERELDLGEKLMPMRG
jgi:aspartyl-tRNA(Asn)/glutamyl-tRNA(Gln) amidotransferase subunit A